LTEAEIIALFTAEKKQSSTVVGIGDDCAVIAATDLQTVITTDALVEGVHFIRAKILPADLGYKAVATNLSDVAAMGATPTHILLSLCMPRGIESSWLRSFADGCKKICRSYGVDIIGGNTSRSERDIVISITAIGRARAEQLKYRHQAKFGDIVFVSRTVGDSAAGMDLLLTTTTPYTDSLIQRHVRPVPEIELGSWLGARTEVNALMDLSDGLLLDVPKVSSASNCGIDIELECIPVSPEVLDYCASKGVEPRTFAISGGEDYALLGTCGAEHWAQLTLDCRAQCGRILQRIGTVTSNQSSVRWVQNGAEITPEVSPFAHF